MRVRNRFRRQYSKIDQLIFAGALSFVVLEFVDFFVVNGNSFHHSWMAYHQQMEEQIHSMPIEEKKNTTTTTTTTTTTSHCKEEGASRNNRNPYYSSITNSSYASWPGIAQETLYGPLVHKNGWETPFANAREFFLSHFEEFLTIYKNRPDPLNRCGIRINHSFALYMAVKKLQPTTIIESGVNSGQSTYFMRTAAGHDCKIISIDPEQKPICGQPKRWIDTNPNTEYLTGENKFMDFDDVNWHDRIHNTKQLDPSNTLVFVDDHIGFLKRFPTIMKYGFRHVINEDNYRIGEGATHGDQRYTSKQIFKKHQDNGNGVWWYHNLQSYLEFPPLFPPATAAAYTKPRETKGGFIHATDDLTSIPQPILDPIHNQHDKAIYDKIINDLHLNPDMSKDDNTYHELMSYNFISYMEVIPLAPTIKHIWKLE